MTDFIVVENPSLPATPPQPSQTTNPPLSESKSDLTFLNTHPFVRDTVLDKVYGCMIGSALGDTVGLYTEFLQKSVCEQAYKERKFQLTEPATEWVHDSHRNRFEKNAWTDDTDQALLILLSYLHNAPHTSAITTLPTDFSSRLRIWISQGLLALDRFPCGIGALVGSVVTAEGYLQDPVSVATKRWLKSGRHVAPNGSVMRTHPIGVMGIGMSEEETWWLSASVGRTTHVDPRCVVSCCIVVGLVRGMLRGEIVSESDVDELIERAYEFVKAQPELLNPELDPELSEFEVGRLLRRKEFERHVYAKEMEDLKLDSPREMGYVYKCVGSAILTLRLGMRAASKSCVPSSTLFEDLMTELIMEGGDADTNGAVAGALLGTYLGFSRLPAHWANGLAHKDWLMDKVERMCKVAGIVDVAGEEIGTVADEAPDGGKGLMNEKELEARDRRVWERILQGEKERMEKEQKDKKKSGKGLGNWFK